MPRATAKKPKIDPTAKYRSWTSFANDVVQKNLVVPKGTVLSGDHPVVQAVPHMFVRADTDESVDFDLEYEMRWGFKPQRRTDGDSRDV